MLAVAATEKPTSNGRSGRARPPVVIVDDEPAATQRSGGCCWISELWSNWYVYFYAHSRLPSHKTMYFIVNLFGIRLELIFEKFLKCLFAYYWFKLKSNSLLNWVFCFYSPIIDDDTGMKAVILEFGSS